MPIKSIGELTDFYYSELYPRLVSYDNLRKKIIRKHLILNSILALLAIPFLLYFSFSTEISDNANSLVTHFNFIIIPWFLIAVFYFLESTKDYEKNFKIEIIRPMIESMGAHLSYSPFTHIGSYHLQRSHLFEKKINFVKGSDHIKGRIDDVYFEFSHVEAYEIIKKEGWFSMPSPYDSAVSDADRAMVFSGFFMVAEFNKHFSDRTVIYSSGGMAQANPFTGLIEKNHLSRIHMDNPQFERSFNVYGGNSIETHYLLTHSMMERMLHLKTVVNNTLFFSFSGGYLYIAVQFGEPIFNVSITRSPLRYGEAKRYFTLLQITLSIIDILHLDTRIWSKADGEHSDIERFLETGALMSNSDA